MFIKPYFHVESGFFQGVECQKDELLCYLDVDSAKGVVAVVEFFF